MMPWWKQGGGVEKNCIKLLSLHTHTYHLVSLFPSPSPSSPPLPPSLQHLLTIPPQLPRSWTSYPSSWLTFLVHIVITSLVTLCVAVVLSPTNVFMPPGGRDKEGLPIITFPSPPKSYVYNRDDVRRLVQYLATIPT